VAVTGDGGAAARLGLSPAYSVPDKGPVIRAVTRIICDRSEMGNCFGSSSSEFDTGNTKTASYSQVPVYI
jgi:hypothetical protein